MLWKTSVMITPLAAGVIVFWRPVSFLQTLQDVALKTKSEE